MLKKILGIYITGFSLLILSAFLCLPDTELFLMIGYLILVGMGIVIEFLSRPFRDFIMIGIILVVFSLMAVYAIYQTSTFQDSKVLYALFIPILIETYRLWKEE